VLDIESFFRSKVRVMCRPIKQKRTPVGNCGPWPYMAMGIGYLPYDFTALPQMGSSIRFGRDSVAVTVQLRVRVISAEFTSS
jgi:hypothetical protein